MNRKPNKEQQAPPPIDLQRVGITIGDINGIGPELVLAAFLNPKVRELCVPILYGSSRVLNIYRKVLRLNRLNYNIIKHPDQAKPNRLNVIECLFNVDRVDIGHASKVGGKAAYLALERALEDAKAGSIDALITLPVDKATVNAHHEGFVGHTEMLAEAFEVKDNLMMMVSDTLKVALVTNHLPIHAVSAAITKEKVLHKIKLMHASLCNDFNYQRPKIAVLGLNPHAGDHGLIGTEEEIISQAIEEANEEGIFAIGPYPADGFFGTLSYRNFDGVLAMYHDQGLIPFKYISGFSGVNFTAGIPFVRTSPDHGVAYDIAGKGAADISSFLHSLYLAIDVFRNRAENIELQVNALKLSAEEMGLSEDNKLEGGDSKKGKKQEHPRSKKQKLSTSKPPKEEKKEAKKEKVEKKAVEPTPKRKKNDEEVIRKAKELLAVEKKEDTVDIDGILDDDFDDDIETYIDTTLEDDLEDSVLEQGFDEIEDELSDEDSEEVEEVVVSEKEEVSVEGVPEEVVAEVVEEVVSVQGEAEEKSSEDTSDSQE